MTQLPKTLPSVKLVQHIVRCRFRTIIKELTNDDNFNSNIDIDIDVDANILNQIENYYLAKDLWSSSEIRTNLQNPSYLVTSISTCWDQIFEVKFWPAPIPRNQKLIISFKDMAMQKKSLSFCPNWDNTTCYNNGRHCHFVQLLLGTNLDVIDPTFPNFFNEGCENFLSKFASSLFILQTLFNR